MASEKKYFDAETQAQFEARLARRLEENAQLLNGAHLTSGLYKPRSASDLNDAEIYREQNALAQEYEHDLEPVPHDYVPPAYLAAYKPARTPVKLLGSKARPTLHRSGPGREITNADLDGTRDAGPSITNFPDSFASHVDDTPPTSANTSPDSSLHGQQEEDRYRGLDPRSRTSGRGL